MNFVLASTDYNQMHEDYPPGHSNKAYAGDRVLVRWDRKWAPETEGWSLGVVKEVSTGRTKNPNGPGLVTRGWSVVEYPENECHIHLLDEKHHVDVVGDVEMAWCHVSSKWNDENDRDVEFVVSAHGKQQSFERLVRGVRKRVKRSECIKPTKRSRTTAFKSQTLPESRRPKKSCRNPSWKSNKVTGVTSSTEDQDVMQPAPSVAQSHPSHGVTTSRLDVESETFDDGYNQFLDEQSHDWLPCSLTPLPGPEPSLDFNVEWPADFSSNLKDSHSVEAEDLPAESSLRALEGHSACPLSPVQPADNYPHYALSHTLWGAMDCDDRTQRSVEYVAAAGETSSQILSRFEREGCSIVRKEEVAESKDLDTRLIDGTILQLVLKTELGSPASQTEQSKETGESSASQGE